MSSKKIDMRSDRGQTMVEFAFVVPILCLLLFGIIQFGIVYHNYVTLTDATRVGARKAIVSGDDPDPVGVTKAAVKKSAVNLDHAKLAIQVTSAGWATGDDVTVEASYPYEINLFGLPVTKGQLTSTTTERVE